jgi:uncharacterized protein DUF4112
MLTTIVRMKSVFLTFAIALLVLAGVGVAGYFILRKVFLRSADRMSHHIAQALTEIADSPLAGRVSATAARVATGRLTNFAAYAAAQGVSEDVARAQFARSIERLARTMDSAIKLPIVGGVGLDALLGLVPVAGDATSAAISISLIARSIRFGVPSEIITKMLANVLLDFLLGAVPLVGDLADIWFKANERNVALLKEYLGDEARNAIDVTPSRV